MFEEIWKEITEYPEYTGLYAVSSQGRVKSLQRPTKITTGNSHVPVKGYRDERILKEFHSRKYSAVKFCNEAKERTLLVHRLVAKAFIPLPQRFIEMGLTYDDLEVNHIDGNPSNNNISNLEWCTKEENMQHAVRTNLIPPGKKGGESPKARKIAMYDLEGNLLKIFDAVTDIVFFFTGKRKGCSHIIQVCKGERRTAFCHIFRYVSNIEAVETKISVSELPPFALAQIKRKEYDTFRSAGQSLKTEEIVRTSLKSE